MLSEVQVLINRGREQPWKTRETRGWPARGEAREYVAHAFAEWYRNGMTRAHLHAADVDAYNAYAKAVERKGPLNGFALPVESVETRNLADPDPIRVRQRASERQRSRRRYAARPQAHAK